MTPSGASSLKREHSDPVDSVLLAHLAPAAIVLTRQMRVVSTRGDLSKTGLRAIAGRKLKGELADLIAPLLLSDSKDSAQNKDWKLTSLPFISDEGEALRCVILESRKAEREIETYREQLLMLLTESETTTEELRSAVEELRAANDELRALNAAVTSANQEVARLNARLERRTQQLESTNLDLSRLLEGLRMPLVVLGPDLHLRRFTSASESVLGLRAAHIGKSIQETPILAPLREDCLNVIDKQSPTTRNLSVTAGRTMQVLIRPFMSEGLETRAVLLAVLPGPITGTGRNDLAALSNS